MKITSSEPKYYLGRSGKELIASLGLNTIGRSKEKEKARYDITNVSMKDISNIIDNYEILAYKGYVRKRTKHEPIEILFY